MLAHDLGNPPFGHQGEIAIGRWFKNHDTWIFSKKCKNGEDLPIVISKSLQGEFTEFDGNPQSFRLITKLQTHIEHLGLDLTAATLAASLKYPVSATTRNREKPAHKKIGYFQSEAKLVEWIREKTGLLDGQRHPLTWIMEACDDIAYSVLDVDDAMKKGIISPDDVLAILAQEQDKNSDPIRRIKVSFERVGADNRRPEVARDIKIGYVRAHLIEALIKEAASRFIEWSDTIMSRKHETPLMDRSLLCRALKVIARQYAFSNTTVLRMEAIGAAAINDLMSFFWTAIADRKDDLDLLSLRSSAKARFGFSLISPNYVEDAAKHVDVAIPDASIRYRELRLLTDMVSGMTDTFAIKLWQSLKEVPDCP
jgi:dGTPase